MAGEIRADRLSYDRLRSLSEDFLRAQHPSGKVPVPIEDIVEFKLRLDIVPVSGLRDALRVDGHGVDGYLSGDRTAIHVDEYVYEKVPNRYRFTLAHEVGHWVLHDHVYRNRQYKNVAEWKAFVNAIDDETHRWLEWQAYAFGGLVLVPTGELRSRFDGALAKLEQCGINPSDCPQYAFDQMVDSLADEFEVSSDVILRRLKYEKFVGE